MKLCVFSGYAISMASTVDNKVMHTAGTPIINPVNESIIVDSEIDKTADV